MAGGDNKTLRFENVPLSALIIRKIDSATGLPVAGATFEVRYLGGTSGSGGTLIKTAVTSINGTNVLTGLQAGTYVCEEKIPAQGFQLSNLSVQTAYISGKDQDVVELVFTNPKMGHLVITKLDSVTGKGIYGVKFLISDAKNNPIRTVESDQYGYVYTTGLPDGEYLIREIEAAAGYIMDTTVKTFYIEYGATTEITWKNTPQQGQIQITKKSADDNPINGFPAGALLEGAKFEIVDKAGNVVDTVVSGRDGRAVSKLLPLGRYFVREVAAPAYYSINTATAEAEIEFSGQIVRLEYLNRSVYKTNLSVDYLVLADSLDTGKSCTIDASPAALRLASNEYITEFMFVFGQVPAGFKDVGGIWQNQWIMAKDRWVTKVYNPMPTPSPLPRTGW